MRAKPLLRAAFTAGLYALAVGCTFAGASAARRHMTTLAHFQGTVLPVALQLPEAERRIAVLQEQVEAADLQRALTGGAVEERLRAFVLPAELSHERIVTFLTAVGDTLERQGLLRERSPVTIAAAGDPAAVPGSTTQTVRLAEVSVRFRLPIDGVAEALQLVSVAGPLTVGDVLAERDRALLLALSEQENPAAITGLEQFFDADLLSYALEPRATADQLLKSFTSEAFAAALETALQGERVRAARAALSGPLGGLLQEGKAWPAPALFLRSLERVRMPDGTVDLTLTFAAPAQG